MKTFVSVLLLLTATISLAFGEAYFGVQAGFSLQAGFSEFYTERESFDGAFGCLRVGYRFSPHINFVGSIDYISGRHVFYEEGDKVTETFKVIPLLLLYRYTYSLGDHQALYGLIGPSLNAWQRDIYHHSDRGMDFGAACGIGYRYTLTERIHLICDSQFNFFAYKPEQTTHNYGTLKIAAGIEIFLH